MSNPFTISIVATIDPVLRTATTLNLALDHPGMVTVTHDILDGAIRRGVADASGVVEQVNVDLAHACLSCAIREDLIPTLVRLRAQGQWSSALVALPVTADPAPLLRSLEVELGVGGLLRGADYGATLTVVDGSTVEHDAFDGTPLSDVRLALHPDDDRVAAEALAPMLGVADSIVLASDAAVTAQSRATVNHLRGDGAAVIEASLSELGAHDALAHRGSPRQALDRVDPLRPSSRSLGDDAGVWTLRLESPHPFHPSRLRENLHSLADHKVRSRGLFWLPSRPGAACLWDGAGRQLSVGEVGRWGRRVPRTHISVTGRGDERSAIAEAFSASLAKPEEIAALRGANADTLSDWFGDDED